MPEDFTLKRVPKTVTDAINNAQTPQELREAALNSMAASGLIVRTRDDEFNYCLNPDAVERPASPVAPMPAPRSSSHTPQHYRVIYPGGNDRYELAGDSEEELDVKEARIRAMYGQR